MISRCCFLLPSYNARYGEACRHRRQRDAPKTGFLQSPTNERGQGPSAWRRRVAAPGRFSSTGQPVGERPGIALTTRVQSRNRYDVVFWRASCRRPETRAARAILRDVVEKAIDWALWAYERTECSRRR